MDFIAELSLFVLKGLFIFLFIAGIIILIVSAAQKAQYKSELTIDKLNKKFKSYEKTLKKEWLTKEQLKAELKKEKKEKENLDESEKPRLFVIDFKGDIKASQVDSLREEVTAILTVAKQTDEVLVCVESPGGVVNNYGLAASELARFREKQIPLVISVDKVAASGGYLMACTANRIICAPFGIVGSIGVVAQVPNLHRILKKNDVDYKEYTAGQYKRTVSLLGEITPQGEAKFLEQLEQTHTLFKHFVSKYRPALDINKVSTGEYWFGEQSLELGLVDQLITSDDYLLEHSKNKMILKIVHEKKQSLSEKINQIVSSSIESSFEKILSKLQPLSF